MQEKSLKSLNEILPNQYNGCLQQFIECCASHVNQLSESYTLHMGVHDFLSILSTYTVWFG